MTNRAIQRSAPTTETSRATRQAHDDVRAAIRDGSAQKTSTFQAAYDAAFKRGLAKWGDFYGQRDAGEAAAEIAQQNNNEKIRPGRDRRYSLSTSARMR